MHVLGDLYRTRSRAVPGRRRRSRHVLCCTRASFP